MKKWLIPSGIVLLSFALVSPAAITSSDAGTVDPHAYRIVGYVMDGEVLPRISASKLDVINFAFAHVNPEHEVFLPNDTTARSLNGLITLRKDNPELKIVLSIGGWGAGHFSEAAATAQSRQRFADTAVELVRRHDLDGVDIDWEYPAHPGPGISHSSADRGNFTLLLKTLRATLDDLGKVNDGRRYLLTIAAAEGEFARGLELKRIAPVLDWINLMTYDFHGSLTPTTGHHAALYRSRLAVSGSRTTERAVDEFLRAGVPAKKLNIGVAFYGRMFAGVGADHDGLFQRFGSDGGFASWQQIQRDYTPAQGYERHWDEAAQAAWLWNPTTRRMISYDDPQTLRAKNAFVRARGLGGVMYWEQRQDPDEQLLDVLVEGLSEQASRE